MSKYTTIQCKFCGNDKIINKTQEGIRKYCDRTCFKLDLHRKHQEKKVAQFQMDLIEGNFKKKVYKIKCHLCGKEEDRSNRVKKVTCFNCKKEKMKVWRTDLTH